MSMTPALAQQIINHFFRQTSQTAPAGCFLALYTVQPNIDGTGGTEVAGGSYARQSVVLTAPDAAGRSTTSAATSFAGMPGVTVVAGGLYTAVSGGTLFQHSPFSITRTVIAGKTLVVPAGDVVVRFF